MSAQYANKVCETVERLSSVCPIDRQQQWHAAGLLLSAVWVRDIDRQRRAPALSSNGAAARLSVANAGSVMLTAEGRS